MRKTITLLAATALLAAGTGTAIAGKDKVYQPSDWNHKKIYVAPAKHLGGAKHGCKKYVEDRNMRKVGKILAIYSSSELGSLTGRGYRVRLGGGRTDKSPRRSNKWKPTLYLSIHSNGKHNRPCSGPPGGTQTYFKKGKKRARKVARVINKRVRKASPGGRLEHKKPIPDASYLELNVSKRPAILLESEYHDWKKGVKFLKKRKFLAWYIARSIDEALGYP